MREEATRVLCSAKALRGGERLCGCCDESYIYFLYIYLYFYLFVYMHTEGSPVHRAQAAAAVNSQQCRGSRVSWRSKHRACGSAPAALRVFKQKPALEGHSGYLGIASNKKGISGPRGKSAKTRNYEWC